MRSGLSQTEAASLGFGPLLVNVLIRHGPGAEAAASASVGYALAQFCFEHASNTRQLFENGIVPAIVTAVCIFVLMGRGRGATQFLPITALQLDAHPDNIEMAHTMAGMLWNLVGIAKEAIISSGAVGCLRRIVANVKMSGTSGKTRAEGALEALHLPPSSDDDIEHGGAGGAAQSG